MTTALYPSDTLYPAETLSPSAGGGEGALYPSESLYPSTTLYPSVGEGGEDTSPPPPPDPDPVTTTQVFRSPTQDWAFRMEGNLFALLPHGLSVWRQDGVWHQGFAPSVETREAAEFFFPGGYDYVLNETEEAALIEGGYADYIVTVEVP